MIWKVVHVKRGDLAGRAKAVFMLVVRNRRAAELEQGVRAR